MNDLGIAEYINKFAQRDVHTIYTFQDGQCANLHSLLDENAKPFVHPVQIEGSNGILEAEAYTKIVAAAANVMLFSIVVDYEIKTEEYEGWKKLVHHLKNLGFARIVNCHMLNEKILMELCTQYNVYYLALWQRGKVNE